MSEASPPRESLDLAPGKLLAGKYEIVEEVSRGAMGKILKVHQPGLDRILAAKIVAPQSSGHDSFKRLTREAQILTKLYHPNIVHVYAAAIDDAFGFVVVMDYLDGTPLSKVITNGQLSLKSSIEFARQIGTGLQYAHENGVLHRDLKPSNVMIVDADGETKAVLIDFGVAKIQKGSNQKLTQTGALLGTPLYMSPEQVMGEELDDRSDIYSFGCMLYEMVTGTTPFLSDSWMELVAKHVNEQPLSPVEHNHKIIPDLEDIILKCLQKRREDRYASMADVVKALESIDFSVAPRRLPGKKTSGTTGIKTNLKIAFVIVPLLMAGLVGAVVYLANWAMVKYPQLDMDADAISQLINKNELSLAKERIKKEIQAAHSFPILPARIPRLYMLMARSDRLSGNYDEALKDIADARAITDKEGWSIDTQLEDGLALFGKHDFSSAAGELDTVLHKVFGREADIERNAWWAKALFFEKVDVPKEQLRKYVDAEGHANYALGHHRGPKPFPEMVNDIDMELIIAEAENMNRHIEDYDTTHGVNLGAKNLLKGVGWYIDQQREGQVPAVLLARYHEEMAEMQSIVGFHNEALRQSKLAMECLSKMKPANKFEDNENQLWADFIRQRLKSLNLN